MISKIFSYLKKPFVWFQNRGLISKIVIVLLVIGGIYFGYNRVFVKSSQAPTYQTAQAEKGTLVSSITASGTISQGSSLAITSQATGVVSKLYVKNGDSVSAGQTIAQITPDLNSQQNQAAAWASYVSASNSLKNAQNSLRGAQASLDKTLDDIHQYQYGNGGFANIGSANETMTQREERTSKQVAVDNAYNSVNSAQAQIASAWLSYQQSSTTISAPFAGTVSGMTVSEGSTLTSSSTSGSNTPSSQTLGSIALPNAKLQATVNLSEIDVTRVKAGQKVTLTMDAFRDKTFTGQVLSLNTNGVVSSGVTTYPTVIQFDSAVEGIYPNMAVNATIITSIKDNVILVPTSAVTTTNGTSTIQVMRNNQPETVEVQVGDANDTQTEIKSGINEGDVIVISTNTTGTSGTTTSPFGNTRGGFGGGRVIQFRGG